HGRAIELAARSVRFAATRVELCLCDARSLARVRELGAHGTARTQRAIRAEYRVRRHTPRMEHREQHESLRCPHRLPEIETVAPPGVGDTSILGCSYTVCVRFMNSSTPPTIVAAPPTDSTPMATAPSRLPESRSLVRVAWLFGGHPVLHWSAT